MAGVLPETAVYRAAYSTVSGRVYPLVLPDNVELPAIVYQRVSTVPSKSLAGTESIQEVRVQCDVWAHTFGDCMTTATALQAALAASPMPNTLDSGSPDYEPETKRYRMQLDYLCWYGGGHVYNPPTPA